MCGFLERALAATPRSIPAARGFHKDEIRVGRAMGGGMRTIFADIAAERASSSCPSRLLNVVPLADFLI